MTANKPPLPVHPREPAIDTLANVMGGCFLLAVIVVVVTVLMVVVYLLCSF